MESGAAVWVRGEEDGDWSPGVLVSFRVERQEEEEKKKAGKAQEAAAAVFKVYLLAEGEEEAIGGAGTLDVHHDARVQEEAVEIRETLPAADGNAGAGGEGEGVEYDAVKLRNTAAATTAAAVADGSGGAQAGKAEAWDVDDLITLTHLHEPAILHTLLLRYARDLIYTFTGPILIAVNPFKALDLYTGEILSLYQTHGELHLANPDDTEALPPHCYATADAAYRGLIGYDATKAHGMPKKHESQSILVSGESGAGKTETTKIVMRYLATIAGRGEETEMGSTIEQQVLQSNPILEAFGNARTVRNDNSSRFGKYIEIMFDREGYITGASIRTYLLEKVRLVRQSEGERNYHIFYLLYAGGSEEQLAHWAMHEVESIEDFYFLSQSGCIDRRDGVADDSLFVELCGAMNDMGLSEDEQAALFQVAAGVLHLGCLEFNEIETGEVGESGSELFEEDGLDFFVNACTRLLGLEKEDLQRALCTRTIVARGDKYVKALTVEEAAAGRDAFAKALYGGLFQWVVNRINNAIHIDSKTRAVGSIGILDIFGFESFEHNSFEQLCINYANETLQQHFNQFVFKLEQQLYEKEQIRWDFIDFPDNQECLDLLEDKRGGIFAFLDEQLYLPQTTESALASKMYQKLEEHPRFSVGRFERSSSLFAVVHYAGRVVYSVDGLVDKNRDAMPKEALDLLDSSQNWLVRDTCSLTTAAQSGAGDGGDQKKAGGRAGRPGGGGAAAAGGGGPRQSAAPRRVAKVKSKSSRNGTSLVSNSVSAQFREQLGTLMTNIRQTRPHYIRCIKPNSDNVADVFDSRMVTQQLRCGGLLEAVRVARAGFPNRLGFDDFVRRYRVLAFRRYERACAKVAQGGVRGDSARYICEQLTGKLTRVLAAVGRGMEQSHAYGSQSDAVIDIPERARGYSVTRERGLSVSGGDAAALKAALESKMADEDAAAGAGAGDGAEDGAAGDDKTGTRDSEAGGMVEDSRDLDASDPSNLLSMGLQMGKTQVFMRARTYDQLEALRIRKMRAAAILLQSRVRCWVRHRVYERMKRSALILQMAVRCFVARSEVHRRREAKAGATLQRVGRGMLARSQARKRWYTLLRVQSLARGWKARARARILRKHRSATTIQAWVRCHTMSRHYARTQAMAVQAQRVVRVFLARRVRKRLKEEARDLGKAKEEQERLKEELAAFRQQLQEKEEREREEEEARKREEQDKEAELERLRKQLQEAEEEKLRLRESAVVAGATPSAAADGAAARVSSPSSHGSDPIVVTDELRKTVSAEMASEMEQLKAQVEQYQQKMETMERETLAAKSISAGSGGSGGDDSLDSERGGVGVLSAEDDELAREVLQRRKASVERRDELARMQAIIEAAEKEKEELRQRAEAEAEAARKAKEEAEALAAAAAEAAAAAATAAAASASTPSAAGNQQQQTPQSNSTSNGPPSSVASTAAAGLSPELQREMEALREQNQRLQAFVNRQKEGAVIQLATDSGPSSPSSSEPNSASAPSSTEANGRSHAAGAAATAGGGDGSVGGGGAGGASAGKIEKIKQRQKRRKSLRFEADGAVEPIAPAPLSGVVVQALQQQHQPKRTAAEVAGLLFVAANCGDAASIRELLRPLEAAELSGEKIPEKSRLAVIANSLDREGRTPLHVAALAGHEDAVKALIDLKSVPNASDRKGDTALHLAEDAAVVYMLCENGANPSMPNLSGLTPLHLAARRRDVDTVRILLEHGADINAVEDTFWHTPLHIAAQEGDLPSVSVLLDREIDASPSPRRERGGSAASSSGQLTPDRRGSDGREAAAPSPGFGSPIAHARQGRADVNCVDKQGNTPLHHVALTARASNHGLLMVLLDSGSNPNIANRKSQTPLHVLMTNEAVRRLGYLEPIVSIMCSKGADPNQANAQGCIPLHLACYYGDISAAVVLMEFGADANLPWRRPAALARAFAMNMANRDAPPAVVPAQNPASAMPPSMSRVTDSPHSAMYSTPSASPAGGVKGAASVGGRGYGYHDTAEHGLQSARERRRDQRRGTIVSATIRDSIAPAPTHRATPGAGSSANGSAGVGGAGSPESDATSGSANSLDSDAEEESDADGANRGGRRTAQSNATTEGDESSVTLTDTEDEDDEDDEEADDAIVGGGRNGTSRVHEPEMLGYQRRKVQFEGSPATSEHGLAWTSPAAGGTNSGGGNSSSVVRRGSRRETFGGFAAGSGAAAGGAGGDGPIEDDVVVSYDLIGPDGRAQIVAAISVPQTAIPDGDRANCMECDTAFGFFSRKHHCRHCQRIVCSDCSPNTVDKALFPKAIAKSIPEDTLRVCATCHHVLITRQAVNRSGRGGQGQTSGFSSLLG